MKLRNQNDTEYGSPQFVPVQKFYEVLQDLEMQYVEAGITRNIDGMTAIYQFYLAKVNPYIEEFFKKDDESLLSLNDVNELRLKMFPEETDHNVTHNSRLLFQISDLMMGKWKRINKLVAISQLMLPLKEIKDLSKAVFEMG